MSALPGDPTPNSFVFPPFVPPVPRTAAPPAQAPARPEPAPETFAMEVPLPAHDLGDPDTDLPSEGFDADEAGSQPWEDAAPPVGEDLPWLEMPAGGPRVHSADPSPARDEPNGWDAASSWEDSAPAAPEPATRFSFDAPDTDLGYAAPAADAGYDAVPAADLGYDPIPPADLGYDAPPAADSGYDAAPTADAGYAEEPAAEFSYDYTPPATEPYTELAQVDDAPAFEAETSPAFGAERSPGSEAADVMPWADDSAGHAFDTPAEPVWEPSFEPAAATPAEDALASEMVPADEFPAEAEAALAYEAAGVSAEVPTSEAFHEAAQIVPAAEPVQTPTPAPAAEYGEVAARLETIARALRDDPASFLAGGSGDALGLLVTGFVLGYGHGRRERAS